jgi:type IV pilus assembly protein PilA
MINRTKKAFTLLELIVVLLVLGILAAIAVPTFNTVKTNSVKKTAETNAQAIARNANAISASEAGGVTDGDHVDTAAGESDATYDASTDTVSASSGSITCTVAITIVDEQAVAGSASC